MIFLVNLLCPSEHPVAGYPVEYANPNPSEEWYRTTTNDVLRLLTRGEVPTCGKCGAQWTRETYLTWHVTISEMRAQTMQEAERALEAVARVERIPD